MTVEWEEGFSIRVDFEKDKKISRQAEFFRLTAVRFQMYSQQPFRP